MRVVLVSLLMTISINVLAMQAEFSDSTKSAKAPSRSGIQEKIKGKKLTPGFITLYQDTVNGSAFIYFLKKMIGQEFIYQGYAVSGPTALGLNQSMYKKTAVYKVKKAFDKLEFIEVNTSYYFDSANPLSKAAETDKPESIFFSEKIMGEDSSGYLIAADGLFVSEKMDPIRQPIIAVPGSSSPFSLGTLNTGKSKYAKIRSYPFNTDVVVDLAYDNSSTSISTPDIADARYIRIRFQHSFIQMPASDYQTRKDDARVGYFIQPVNDMTSLSATPFKDVINRWKLIKKDPEATLSDPIEPIVFWVENTTPYEFRQIVKDAALKWNDAFVKAGFKNALIVNQMPDDAQWDPADIRYNVIRWVSSIQAPYSAIGPTAVNPRTGQILGADITIEWSGATSAMAYDDLYSSDAGEINVCSLSSQLRAQQVSGLTFSEANGVNEKGKRELSRQFLFWMVMHEVGHTLGLNHNMMASQMLSPAQLNDTLITRKKGLIGSVMDYPAVNVALDRTKQGDYYTTTLGPYDLWAIEYGYTTDESRLQTILARSTEMDLAFGNDGDDMRTPGKGIDPRINLFDLSNDVITFAEDRFKLINATMSNLLTRFTKPDQSFAELRSRYLALQRQRLDMAGAVSRYVGGVYIDRSLPGQHSVNKPFTPVPKTIQKKAVLLLSKYLFAPEAFDNDTAIYPYLQMQRRGFNQPLNGEDYKIVTSVHNLQVSGAMQAFFNQVTFSRIINSSLYGNKYGLTEVMSDLGKAVFDADLNSNVNVHRQMLQSTFVKGLIAIISETSLLDEVTKSAARYSLKQIQNKLIKVQIGNLATKAHRENLLFYIHKSLRAKEE